MNEENSKQTEKNPMDKKTLIIVGIALLLVVVIALVFILKPNGGVEKPKEQTITLVGTELSNGELLITATNTKKETYDIEFNVTFYDDANQQIKEYQESILAIEPNMNGYHTINISDVLGKRYEFTITTEKEIPADRMLTQTIQLNQSVVGEDMLDIGFENTSDSKVDTVQVAVLFYKDDKIIDYTSQYVTDVDAKQRRRENVMIPRDEKGDVIRFDKHEVILTAYNIEK